MSFTALITGATGGLGHSFVEILAGYPCTLIVTGRNEEALQALKTKYESETRTVVPIVCDLSKEEGARSLYEQVKKGGYEVDYLINNAGFGDSQLFVDEDPELVESLLNVNIVALTLLSRYFLPDMIERRHGGILQVSSIASLMAGPGMALYYSSKAYVSSFGEALHEELKEYDIHVTNLCPAPTKTGFEKNAHLEKSMMFKVFPTAEPMDVAKAGLVALARNEVFCYPDPQAKLIWILSRILPRCITRDGAWWINKAGSSSKQLPASEPAAASPQPEANSVSASAA